MEGRPAELTAPDGYAIRPGRREDVEDLRRVEVDAGRRFLEVGFDDVANDDPPSAGELRSAIDDGMIWVAEDGDGQVVAYARALDLDGQAHLEQLSVAGAHERRGLATALIDVVAAWAATHGSRTLTLSTFAEVAFNGPFYERRGFETLPPAEWGRRFTDLRAHEAALGLDVDARIIMRRAIVPHREDPAETRP